MYCLWVRLSVQTQESRFKQASGSLEKKMPRQGTNTLAKAKTPPQGTNTLSKAKTPLQGTNTLSKAENALRS